MAEVLSAGGSPHTSAKLDERDSATHAKSEAKIVDDGDGVAASPHESAARADNASDEKPAVDSAPGALGLDDVACSKEDDAAGSSGVAPQRRGGRRPSDAVTPLRTEAADDSFQVNAHTGATPGAIRAPVPSYTPVAGIPIVDGGVYHARRLSSGGGPGLPRTPVASHGQGGAVPAMAGGGVLTGPSPRQSWGAGVAGMPPGSRASLGAPLPVTPAGPPPGIAFGPGTPGSIPPGAPAHAHRHNVSLPAGPYHLHSPDVAAAAAARRNSAGGGRPLSEPPPDYGHTGPRGPTPVPTPTASAAAGGLAGGGSGRTTPHTADPLEGEPGVTRVLSSASFTSAAGAMPPTPAVVGHGRHTFRHSPEGGHATEPGSASNLAQRPAVDEGSAAGGATRPTRAMRALKSGDLGYVAPLLPVATAQTIWVDGLNVMRDRTAGPDLIVAAAQTICLAMDAQGMHVASVIHLLSMTM